MIGGGPRTRPDDGDGARFPKEARPVRVVGTTGYRYCPVFDSVSIARLAEAFLPVTRVRM